ncbi:MAG TPA: PAS domain S-box protein [Prolixibacteraceae bacterium]|nr:PAS domain S-box protein [Prolixibacteraceae bacterium]
MKITIPINNNSFSEPSDTDIMKINYELELAKIELELQNEELRRTAEKAETAIALYDFSPVGYFTLKEDGTIVEVNVSGACMLGEERPVAGNKNIRDYISPDYLPVFKDFLEIAFETRTKKTCELKIVSSKNPSHTVFVYVEGIASGTDTCLMTAVNIGEQKRAEEQITKQIKFFEQIFAQSSVSTQIMDKDGWCLRINPKLTQLFGVKPEDIEGRKYNIFKDESLIKEGIIPLLGKVFREGKTAEWDIYFDMGLAAQSQNIKVSNKQKQWFHNWAYPIFDEEGRVANVIIQHTDISERKKDEERISASEARYRTLFETAKDGIIILDAFSGHIIDINPYTCQLLGYMNEELMGKKLQKMGIFKNDTDTKEIFKELQNKDYLRFENILLVSKYGKIINVEFTCNAYTMNHQKVIQCNIRNITERIKAEKEIHTLRKAIEQGPSAITITNAEGKIEFVNNKFTELTQYHPLEVWGKNPRIFNPGHLPEEQYAELWEALKSGKTWEGKVMNRRKDNTFFWEATSISAVKNLDGSISNYILIQNDISEKQQIINDLIKAKERAEEGDHLKTAFLANMSHEIRTPLNSIIGFSELMTDSDFDPEQLFHFAHIINSSGNKLLCIISDIMDLSKIEAGEVRVDKRKLCVNHLIKDIQKEYLFKAIEKGLELRLDPQNTSEEVFVESDENKLRQILINFVGNAIKFTDEGYIELGMRIIDNFVQLQVKDTGIGIPSQYQEKIFERFRQVESAYSRKYGGNGLGLAISKALVELLGGNVGMETEHGKGSVFYFTIPLP